jgi:hypothetical protein
MVNYSVINGAFFPLSGAIRRYKLYTIHLDSVAVELWSAEKGQIILFMIYVLFIRKICVMNFSHIITLFYLLLFL